MNGDWNWGNGGLPLPFHGRSFHFKAGFAELAVNTDAEVIPIFISLKPTGHFHVAFLEPLNRGDPGINREKRIESLVQQFAELLERQWAQEPANVAWKVMRRFLNSPLIDSGIEEEERVNSA